MLLDWTCRLLARMKARTPLAQRLHTILCKKVLKERGGLFLPRYGLILVEDKPYIWEVPSQTFSLAYMTKASKRKLLKQERAGVMKSSTDESQRQSQLANSIKAKLLMIALLLLLLLTSLTEEWLYRKLKELEPVIEFKMNLSTIAEKKVTMTDSSDGLQLSLPPQSES